MFDFFTSEIYFTGVMAASILWVIATLGSLLVWVESPKLERPSCARYALIALSCVWTPLLWPLILVGLFIALIRVLWKDASQGSK